MTGGPGAGSAAAEAVAGKRRWTSRDWWGGGTKRAAAAAASAMQVAAALAWIRRRLHDLTGHWIGVFYASFTVWTVAYASYVAAVQPPFYPAFREQFYMAAIAATAGTVSIVMSISIFIIQSAASTYTPTILRRYLWDRWFWYTLLFSIITIALMSADLMYEWDCGMLHLANFLGALALVAVFFLHMIRKVDPLSIVTGVRNDMTRRFREIRRSSIRLYKARVEDIMEDPKNKSHQREIVTDKLALRQVILQSIKKGDYDTLRECLMIYEMMLGEHLDVTSGRRWSSDEFLRAIVVDMDFYWELGIREDKQVLSNLIGTYGRMCDVSIEKTGSESIIIHGSNVLLGKLLESIERLGVELARNGDSNLAGELLYCLRDICTRSCSEYKSDNGVLTSVCRIARAAADSKTSNAIPSIAAIVSYEVVESMIRNVLSASDIERAVGAMSAPLAVSVRADAEWQVGSSRFRQMFRKAASCVIDVMLLTVDNTEDPDSAGSAYKNTIIAALIGSACNIAVKGGSHDDWSEKDDVMRFLLLVTWALAGQSRDGSNSYGKSLERAFEWAKLAHSEGDAPSIKTTADVAMMALYCHACGHHEAGDLGIDIIHGSLEKITESGHPENVLKVLDGIGALAADKDDGRHAEAAARCWIDCANACRSDPGWNPPADPLAYTAKLIDLYPLRREPAIPAKHALRMHARDDPIRLMLSEEKLDRFNDVKHRLGLP